MRTITSAQEATKVSSNQNQTGANILEPGNTVSAPSLAIRTPRDRTRPATLDSSDVANYTLATVNPTTPELAATTARGKTAQQANALPMRMVALYAFSAFLTMVPVTLLVPVIKPLVQTRFGASLFESHLFLSINLIGATLAAPFIARLCNRAGARVKIAVVALIGDAVLLSCMHLAGSIQALLFIRFVEGMTHILALSALMAVAADRAPPQKRGAIMGMVGAAMMFGTAAGTRIGGFVTADAAFLIAGSVSILAALFITLFVPSDKATETVQRQKMRLSLLREKPSLSVVYAFAFVDRFCVGVIISSFNLYLANVHNLSHQRISTLLVMFLLPFAVLVYPAGRVVDRIGPRLPVSLGSIGFGFVMAAYGFVPPSSLWILMLLSGVLSALMFAPTLTLCAELSPPDQRGAAYAGFNASGSVGMVFGPIVGGMICTLAQPLFGINGSYQAAFIVAGATQVIIALIALPVLKRALQQHATA